MTVTRPIPGIGAFQGVAGRDYNPGPEMLDPRDQRQWPPLHLLDFSHNSRKTVLEYYCRTCYGLTEAVRRSHDEFINVAGWMCTADGGHVRGEDQRERAWFIFAVERLINTALDQYLKDGRLAEDEDGNLYRPVTRVQVAYARPGDYNTDGKPMDEDRVMDLAEWYSPDNDTRERRAKEWEDARVANVTIGELAQLRAQLDKLQAEATAS